MTRIALGTLIALLLVAGHAGAQEMPRERASFEEGTAALNRGEFDRAVTLLRESLELSPNRAAAFHLALALRGAGRAREAVALFDELLGATYGELGPAPRADVIALRELAASTICELRIESESADTEIRVDGDRVEAGVLALNPGPHILTATRIDHLAWESRIELAPGEHRTVAIRLEPSLEPGYLAIQTDDESTRIEVIGVGSDRGRFERSVPPGSYVIRLSIDGHNSESSAEVLPGRRLALVLAAPRGTRSVADEPAFWLILVGTLVAGGGVTLGLALQQGPTPVGDPVFGVVTTLTVRL